MKLIIGSQYPINGPWSKSKHTVLSLLNCQISAPSPGILIPYWGPTCFLIHSSHVQFYNNNKTFSLCKKTINIVLILQRNQGSEWPSTVTQQIIGKNWDSNPARPGSSLSSPIITLDKTECCWWTLWESSRRGPLKEDGACVIILGPLWRTIIHVTIIMVVITYCISHYC